MLFELSEISVELQAHDINLFTANNKLKMHIQLFEDRKSDSRPHNRVALKAAGNSKFRSIIYRPERGHKSFP
jgi:hypothetical protein